MTWDISAGQRKAQLRYVEPDRDSPLHRQTGHISSRGYFTLFKRYVANTLHFSSHAYYVSVCREFCEDL